MERLIEKFNIFDIVAMLIPGLTFIFCVKLNLIYYLNIDLYNIFGVYTLVVLLIFGYDLGFIFQEIGSKIDKHILQRIYYGEALNEIFLVESKK